MKQIRYTFYKLVFFPYQSKVQTGKVEGDILSFRCHRQKVEHLLQSLIHQSDPKISLKVYLHNRNIPKNSFENFLSHFLMDTRKITFIIVAERLHMWTSKSSAKHLSPSGQNHKYFNNLVTSIICLLWFRHTTFLICHNGH